MAKIKIEQKFQMEYIKHPRETDIMAAGEDYIFLQDGSAGAYINKKSLLIAIPNDLELEENKYITPEQLFNLSVEAITTDELKIDAEEHLYRKLLCDSGYVWVENEDLKKFGKLAEYRIMENKCNVCVTINGRVKGAIRCYLNV